MVNKSFDFSVIMAVYNVEAYLEEAVESLIQQDYGFDHIQLILVDDGSPDNSGKICDTYQKKYPDNIFVLHQENAGVSAARNAGLELATGTYLNFMDSDDKLERNAMSEVKKFFDTHGDETDIVAIPFRYFDGQEGDSHPQNGKFKQGTRVINLDEDCTAYQLSLGASFVKREKFRGLKFDSRLKYMEDAKVILQYLSQSKPFLGVISTTLYWYRKRSAGEASATQSSSGRKDSFLPVIYYFYDELIAVDREKLPRFIQSVFAYDLQWRYKAAHFPKGVLSIDEEKIYAESIYSYLKYIDDDIILQLKYINWPLKCYLLCRKYKCSPVLKYENGDFDVYVNSHRLGSLSNSGARLEFLSIQNNMIIIEGWIKTFEMAGGDKQKVFLSVNGKLVSCQLIERENLDQLSLENHVDKTIAFQCKVPLSLAEKRIRVFPVIQYQNKNVTKEITSYGNYFPISREFQASYYCESGWIVHRDSHGLVIARDYWYSRCYYEFRFCKELLLSRFPGSKKAVFVRTLARIAKRLKRRPLWLISDRPGKADDNGEAFFHYMRECHPEINSVFVLNSDSPDRERISGIGPVIQTLSIQHKFLFLIADYNISSQADEIVSNPFPGYSAPYKDILTQSKNVFLQHGIIKDDLSGWLNRYKKNLYGFVTSVEPEYRSVIDGNYYYTEKQVWLTGLPRYDYLYNDSQKMIVIAPTWRRYLAGKYNQASGVWSIKPDFEESEYVKFYAGLLSHPRLLEKAQQMGYAIHFFPHPNFQPYIQCFHCPSSIVLHGKETHYRDMYAQASLFVTDYSSACFDFVYLYKPVIYCQFDAKTFFSGAHSYTKGYFDYERDGFGEVEYDLEGTVERIIEYMETDCKLKEKYRKRIDVFFAFHDKKNCERVYQKLVEHSDID